MMLINKLGKGRVAMKQFIEDNPALIVDRTTGKEIMDKLASVETVVKKEEKE